MRARLHLTFFRRTSFVAPALAQTPTGKPDAWAFADPPASGVNDVGVAPLVPAEAMTAPKASSKAARPPHVARLHLPCM